MPLPVGDTALGGRLARLLQGSARLVRERGDAEQLHEVSAQAVGEGKVRVCGEHLLQTIAGVGAEVHVGVHRGIESVHRLLGGCGVLDAALIPAGAHLVVKCRAARPAP